MPVIEKSSYHAPMCFANGHIQTIYPSLFRKITDVVYQRERIDTPDNDFLDLDWSVLPADKLAIISHGLEGNSERSYVKGMVRALNRAGWDALAWNFRGCSGEPNRCRRSYHSGATDDLETVLKYTLKKSCFRRIVLIGFSMGGNLTLKYLGERGDNIPSPIDAAVTFSVPCDLAASSRQLDRFSNRIYLKRFLRLLHQKIRDKMKLFPGEIDDRGYRQIQSFKDFDDRYTAPWNGFENAQDYWTRCSSKQFIPAIAVPVLLVNAENDPFLTPDCFPMKEARQNRHFFLEHPSSGGHVGFVSFNQNGIYWSEQRAITFINDPPC